MYRLTGGTLFRPARASTGNLGFLLAKATQRWNELLMERFREAGYAELRPAYGSILLPLFEQDGLRMGELARRSRLSKQTMTTLVRAMEEKGLVRRTRDPEDARAFRISLTRRSRQFRAVAEGVLEELERSVRATLSPARLAGLRESLTKIMNLDVPERFQSHDEKEMRP